VRDLTLREFWQIPGRRFGTPKEVWGFRMVAGSDSPTRIARAFIEANTRLFKVGTRGLGDPKVLTGLGASHVIFQQRYQRLRIRRAYVTVHVANGGHVYLAKNRAVPRDLLRPAAEFGWEPDQARQRALNEVRTRARGELTVVSTERMWFGVKRGRHDYPLRPAYRVLVRRALPRADWIIYVDAANGRILKRYNNLAEAGKAALVFDPNPVIALRSAADLVRQGVRYPPPRRAYTRVVLQGLDGSGHLDGRYVTTRPTRHRFRARDGDFRVTSDRRGFTEVMAYFHIDGAIRYLERLGYKGRRAIFREPLDVDVDGMADDNSEYSPHLRRITLGRGGVPDAEDADVILHEFGHAIQDAICPNFGQSAQAAAIGEGFGDYLAASYFDHKRSPAYRTSVMTWDCVLEKGVKPPCLRRVDSSKTFNTFDGNADEHETGEIWSATLWDVAMALGRRVADRIIVDSHFQLDGYTTFAQGARAILDADRNLYRGRHERALRRIFARRKISPVGES
jgi:Fungalysin metallopeptidase (M36)